MTHRAGCTGGEALIAFLYGETDTRERAHIAEHLSGCAACAAELDALSATRGQLAAWTPPDAQFDFRLPAVSAPTALAAAATPVPERAATPGRTSAPHGWWARPLPAWAQLAASLAIFVAGVGVGGSRILWPGAGAPSAGDVRAVNRVMAASTPEPPAAEADVAAIESRLRELEARAAPQPAGLTLDARARAAIVRDVIRDLERDQPWNPAVRDVLVTVTGEYQRDIALLRRQLFGVEPAGAALTATALAP